MQTLPFTESNSSEPKYTIGEASDLLGISIQSLRLYEREGLILPQRRTSKHRRYTQSDLERIRCLREMITKQKISIEGIKRLMAMIPCWKMKHCPEEERNACPAYLQYTLPCWMASVKSLTCKNEECRLCTVYTSVHDCSSLKQTIAQFTISL